MCVFVGVCVHAHVHCPLSYNINVYLGETVVSLCSVVAFVELRFLWGVTSSLGGFAYISLSGAQA